MHIDFSAQMHNVNFLCHDSFTDKININICYNSNIHVIEPSAHIHGKLCTSVYMHIHCKYIALCTAEVDHTMVMCLKTKCRLHVISHMYKCTRTPASNL